MGCPPLEQLLGGAEAEHALGCSRCRAILALAATRAPEPCGIAEALLAARAAGAVDPEAEKVLIRHLETCAACFQVARDLEQPAFAEAIGMTTDDLAELTVVPRENYVPGREIGRGGMGRIVFARDRRLGRTVAIKELLDARLRARFEREARLTARLQHPAIVSVHEAGRWPSGEPFYAMKYVAGKPLHKVIEEKTTLAERLGLLPHFTTVAEAIAYAHSEGVIHRDLKPHNILIGAFGETVVIDWGLAKDLSEPLEPGSPYRGDGTFTAAGAGTPAYMAPEQKRGELPDVGVDIYALGATLFQVLSGDLPRGEALPDGVPGELRDIVHKAMAPERADRYATAADLAEELRRFQTGQLVRAHRYSLISLASRWLVRHRNALFGLVAAAASVFAIVTAVRRSGPPFPGCGVPAEALAGAWDPTVRAALERSFVASGRPYAEDTVTRVAASLGAYATRWTAMRKEACEATAVRHEQSEALLDLRMRCLDRRRDELGALTGLLGRNPDGELVDRAVMAVKKLDDIQACADAEALSATAPLPADPAARIEIASLRGRLAAIHALTLGGRSKAADEVIRPVLADVNRLAYPPLELEALYELGWVQALLRDFKGLEATARRRLELAAALKNDYEIASAWLRLMVTLIYTDRSNEALALRPVVEVAIVRAGKLPAQRVELFEYIGRAHMEKGEFAEAELALRQAIALAESGSGVDGVDIGGTWDTLGTVLRRAGKDGDSRVAHERAIDIWQRQLGPGHPYIAGTLMNIAILVDKEGKYEEARALFERAQATFERALGPEAAAAAIALTNLGWSEVELGRYADAVQHEEQALAIKVKRYGATNRQLSSTLDNLGVGLARLGRWDEAEATLERARAIVEKSAGATHPDYAEILSYIGLVAELRGRCRDAIDAYRRALAIDERVLAKDHPDLVPSLLGIGRCELALERPRAAIPLLERAVAIRGATGGDPADVAEAEFALGQARFALSHDAHAIALVQRSRAGFAALGPLQIARVPEVDRWLSAHRR